MAAAVAFKSRPGRVSRPEFSPLTAVHAANALCGGTGMDLEYLHALGLDHRLDAWRDLLIPVPEKNLYQS